MATYETALRDFHNNGNGIAELFMAGIGNPTGEAFVNNLDSDGEDYCEITEIIDGLDLWELAGNMTDGKWEWNGIGNPVDNRGNSILKIQAK